MRQEEQERQVRGETIVTGDRRDRRSRRERKDKTETETEKIEEIVIEDRREMSIRREV